MEVLVTKPRMHLQRHKGTTLLTSVSVGSDTPYMLCWTFVSQSQILQLIKEDNRAFDCLCWFQDCQMLVSNLVSFSILLCWEKFNRGPSCDPCGSKAKHCSSVPLLCPSPVCSLSPCAGWHLGSPLRFKWCHSARLCWALLLQIQEIVLGQPCLCVTAPSPALQVQICPSESCCGHSWFGWANFGVNT